MTQKQKHFVEFLKGHHLKVKSYGNIEGYETKKYDVKEEKLVNGKTIVFILSEIGMKEDENTYASIFCRDRRHLMITEEGGLYLLNEKNDKKITGLFRSFNSLTY